MTYRPVDVVEVWAWDVRVGAVAQDPTSGHYVFAYTPEWLQRGIELAPIKMPNRLDPYDPAKWPELPPDAFMGLVPLVADALPDAFGNALVNAWMAEHGVAADQITPLDRLAHAADRSVGALEFRPPARRSSLDAPTAVQLADLVLAARLTVEGDFAPQAGTHAALQQLIQVGSSAGGARAKALVAFNPVTWQMRSAFAAPEDGYEQWLIKLDGVSATGLDGHGDGLGEGAPYGRIEYAYSQMARAAGISMSDCRLLPEGPRCHFLTRRFDRGDGGSRHHVLSLAAMANLDARMVGTHSYDEYLQVIAALGIGSDGLDQGFRRMVFNVLSVNRDDHTKNFAFLLRQGASGWELAPAFDVTHTYRPSSPWTSRHNLSVNGRTEDIAIADLHEVGDRNGVPGFRRIVREVSSAVDEWRSFAESAGVDANDVDSIATDLELFRPR
jgi:serine/threonine-protein kinase HipA